MTVTPICKNCGQDIEFDGVAWKSYNPNLRKLERCRKATEHWPIRTMGAE